MRVSHETIYQALFVQGRGELRRELTSCLRTERVKRRARQRPENTGRIPDMVMISERPAEADDRAVPGHWEGDLILGKDSKSAVGTLVERSTRFLLLLHLPEGRTARSVEQGDAAGDRYPARRAGLHHHLGPGQGDVPARPIHCGPGVQVYFCDPHKWQRGSNENTNGLLRQYMPKGTDLSVHTADDLARFARSLNTRPRKPSAA